MRTGVLGGSFNPLHLGHLLVADDVRRRFRLDRVLFLAGPRPPHKPARDLAPWPHRRRMLSLGLAGWPQFELSDVEELLPGPGYTVRALALLRRARPRDSLYLVLGADQYRAMPGWHEPGRLTDHARVIVMSRPGTDRPRRFPGHAARRVTFTPVIEVDLAGRDIRARLARGASVRYMLPTPVWRYVRRHRLYVRTAAQ
ncbi:MAG: nicotinate (nicotinamide) nucleotide adenylyltransferase [bacterium]